MLVEEMLILLMIFRLVVWELEIYMQKFTKIKKAL
jgi:hypothetical protein